MIRWLKLAESYVLDRLGRAVAIVAVLVSGLFGGGMAEVPKPGAASVTAGEAFDTGPALVTPLRASIYGETPKLFLTDKSDHWIVLIVRVEVTTTGAWELPSLLVTNPELPGLLSAAPTVYRAEDRTMVTRIDPGLPVELAYVWEQKGTQTPPASITVHLGQWTYREDSVTPFLTLPGYKEWLPSDDRGDNLPGAVTSVPVVDKRVTDPAPSASPSVTP